MARAHDLLTDRNWSSADFALVVTRALEPFSLDRFLLSGPAFDVSPRHVLAFSMALHELATNATKYGALSNEAGRVSVNWDHDAETLRLNWREVGGPKVTPPSRRGFGSRLLEAGLMRELKGASRLEFSEAGVQCDLSAALAQPD